MSDNNNPAGQDFDAGQETVVAARVSQDFDMGQAAAKLSKAQIKEIDRRNKAMRKKYHVSNVQIIKNYKNYSASEKAHYRYIFGLRVSNTVWPIFRMVVLVGLAFVIMYPILYMISTSVRPQAEMSDPSVMWIPKTFTMSNFVDVWNFIHIPLVLKNTLVVNVVCSMIQVVTCSITGYGFARFKFPGRNLLFGVVLMQIVVPVQVIMIPLYMQFRYFDPLGLVSLISGAPLNLADNPMALYLQAVFNNGIRAGLFILLFRQFFRGLPKELEDAAHLDGCGPLGTFVRIMVPNAMSSYLTVFIFSIVWYWNDTYISGMFFTQNSTIAMEIGNAFQTISAALSSSGTPQGVAQDYIVWVEATCLFAVLPILIMYIFLQRYFIEGVERSGIVG